MNETVLATAKLSKYYQGRAALDHLDLEIPCGCVCGLIGRNGAGKTTAIKLMLGLLRPTFGSATLLGCDSQELTPRIRQRIGYLAEGHHLFPGMTIAQSAVFQSAFHPGTWDASFFSEMMEYFALPPRQKIKQLSPGERAQVALSLALAPQPELLIMDDPTLGLDATIRRQFLEEIIRLIMQSGRTVLFSSHILSDVERIADRIVILDRGVLLANCSLEQFRSTVQKVKFQLKNANAVTVAIDGLLSWKQSRDELELTLVGSDSAQIVAFAEEIGASHYEIGKMNLEDQFIEFTTSGGSR